MYYVVDIDIGGTNIRAALLDEDRNILEKIKFKNEVDKGLEYNLNKITTHINENWISKGISNIISVVDPEAIVLGGSVVLYNKDLLETIIEKVREKVINKEAVDIRIAEIGDDAGLRVAGLLIK